MRARKWKRAARKMGKEPKGRDVGKQVRRKLRGGGKSQDYQMPERSNETGPEKQLQNFIFQPGSLKYVFIVSVQNAFREWYGWILYLIFSES